MDNIILPTLSQSELDQYACQMVLPDFGLVGQKLLKNAKILCVGAGGLGCPVLMHLASCGIGTIGIVDKDKIENSNLPRQILYYLEDVGRDKGEVAKVKLRQRNPNIDVILHSFQLTKENALSTLAAYEIVVDCTDNFSSRFLINDACFQLKKPLVSASIFQFTGQCSVFTFEGPCYRCLYDSPPPNEFMPNCATAGVLGAVTGLLGSIQTIEVIKLILKQGKNLQGRLLIIDALTMQFKEYDIPKNKNCSLCSNHRSFDQFISTQHNIEDNKMINEISVQELQALKEKNADIFLLDVREPFEYQISNLGGYLIPLGELAHRLIEIDEKKQIIVHCKMGGRSRTAAELLIKHGMPNVSVLKGGIQAWMEIFGKEKIKT